MNIWVRPSSERGGHVRAFQLVAQVLDFRLRGLQAIEELFLMVLHGLGAGLQVVEDVGQFVDHRLAQRFQTGDQTLLVGLAARYAADYAAFDLIDQFDDLLLAGTGFLQLAANDVFAKQFAGRFRRNRVEILDELVQAPVQLLVLAAAIAVPQGKMQGRRRDVVAHHLRHGLLE